MLFLRSYLLFIAWLLLTTNHQLRAQSAPDSLLHKLASVSNDSTKAITLLEIGESIEVSNPLKSMEYYRQALLIGKRINNNRVILSSYHDIGVCYINLNKMDSAITTFENAIPFAWRLKDTLRVARLYGNIGNAYLHKKDRVKGIDYYVQSARLWETCADQNYLALVYSNINGLLDEQKEHTKAAEYGNKAIALAEKIGDGYSLVNGLVNLAVTYGFLDQPEKQIALLNRALPLAKKNNDLDQVATVYHNMGDYYFNKSEFLNALDNYIHSYNYVSQMGNKYHLCTICTALAQVYHKLQQDGDALQFIIKAEALANEVGTRADLIEIYKTRAEIEQGSGNYKVAGKYFSKTIMMADSLFKVETSEKVAEVEAQYQNEKKQKEIVQLEKDKEIHLLTIKQKSTFNYFLIGFLAALMIVSFLVYRNFQNRQLLAKQQEELQEQRIRELEKDKQLIAVDSLLKGQEEERSRLAKDLHDGLGGLLSGVKFSLSNMKSNLIVTPDNMAVFERSLDMIDTSIGELRRVAHNMMPELLTKFGLDEAMKEYCNMINTTKLIVVKYQSLGMETLPDKSAEIIIYRIIQELLNNILKHASAKEAFVQIIRDDHRLSIIVEDNGKGFDTRTLENIQGAGWTNIWSRVNYLKGRLDIQSEANKGTTVTIEFNV